MALAISVAMTTAIVALLALVLQTGSTSGLAIAYDERAEQHHHHHEETCCTPDQWEASRTYVMAGNAYYSGGYGRIAHDYANQVLALNQTLLALNSTKAFHQQMLLIGRSRKLYALDLLTGHCNISFLPAKLQHQCISSHYHYESNISLGDSFDRMVGLVYHASHAGHSFTKIVSQKQCAPVFDMRRQLGTDQLAIASTFNFTTGIRDRSVFNVPPRCLAAESHHMEHGPELVPILEQF